MFIFLGLLSTIYLFWRSTICWLLVCVFVFEGICIIYVYCLLVCLFLSLKVCYLSTYLFRSFRVIGCVFVLERMKVLVFEVRHIKLLISRTCYMKGTWNSLIQKTISNKTNNHCDFMHVSWTLRGVLIIRFRI